MKRKRTLSGIRGALDYKNLNVFGDIVANFHGRNIPSVEDFSTYLQSHDYCDNLKFLSNQSNSTKQPENPPINNTTGDKVAKRGRKPKKPSPDDDVNSEEPPSNAFEPPAQIMPPVMGSIGHFFYRFSQTYPRGTKIYNTFVTLARAYEGKVIDESAFYSSMKKLLATDDNNFLTDFVDLIRPEDAIVPADLSIDSLDKEDFPFNETRKKIKNPDFHQLITQPHLHQLPPPLPASYAAAAAAAAAATTAATTAAAEVKSAKINVTPLLTDDEVMNAVKVAVQDKAKDFLLQAKSSMDPHTYVSFLDIMVELRSLYKSNAIEEAIEKLDIVKGILTRVNPQLRVELDRYFPIVNANGAKHTLEHHTFEQSQRQYREWQQAQVARKNMFTESSDSSPASEKDSKPSGSQDWWATIAHAKPHPALQKKERMKLSAFEKEHVQNAKKVAKETALLKNSSNVSVGVDVAPAKEDLLDALTSTAVNKTVKKRVTPTNKTISSRTSVKGSAVGAAISAGVVGKTGAPGARKIKDKDKTQRQGGSTSTSNSTSGGRPVQKSKQGTSLQGEDRHTVGITTSQLHHPHLHPHQSLQNQQRHSFVSQNTLPDFGTYKQGDRDFIQFMHKQQQHQQHQQHHHHVAGLSGGMTGSLGGGGGGGRFGDSTEHMTGHSSSGYDSLSNSGGMGSSSGASGMTSFPYSSSLSSHSSMMHPAAAAAAAAAASLKPHHSQPHFPQQYQQSQYQHQHQQHQQHQQQMHQFHQQHSQHPPQQFSSYGLSMGVMRAQHQQHQSQSQGQSQGQNQQHMNYIPAFQGYGNLSSSASSSLPARLSGGSTSSSSPPSTTLLPPPPKSMLAGGMMLPSYASASSLLPPRTAQSSSQQMSSNSQQQPQHHLQPQPQPSSSLSQDLQQSLQQPLLPTPPRLPSPPSFTSAAAAAAALPSPTETAASTPSSHGEVGAVPDHTSLSQQPVHLQSISFSDSSNVDIVAEREGGSRSDDSTS